jgi:hypothetical protein
VSTNGVHRSNVWRSVGDQELEKRDTGPIENRISSGRGLHVRATLLSRRHPPPPPIMTPFDQRILRDRGRLTCRHGFTMAASPLPFLEMVSVVPLVVWPNSPVCTYAKSVPNRDLFTGRASGQPCPEGPPLARPPEAVGATHHSEQSNAWSVSSSHACCGEYHNQPALSVSCPERHHAPELRSRELPASVKTRSGCWNTTRLHSRCDHPAATHASWVAPPALSTSPAREEPTTVYAGGSEARQ